MKQKFAIIRDDAQSNLIVREYAELDKEIMSLLCEETYPLATLQSAIAAGSQVLINALRTNNMYPPTVFAQAIANAVESMLAESGDSSVELLFDDKELFDLEDNLEVMADEETEIEADEEVEVDDLLNDDMDDDFEDDKVLKDLKSSIQVADEDDTDLDD